MSHPKPKALFFEARADHENSLSLWLSNLWATQSKQSLSFSSLSSVSSFFMFCFSIKLSTFLLSFASLPNWQFRLFIWLTKCVCLSFFFLSIWFACYLYYVKWLLLFLLHFSSSSQQMKKLILKKMDSNVDWIFWFLSTIYSNHKLEKN